MTTYYVAPIVAVNGDPIELHVVIELPLSALMQMMTADGKAVVLIDPVKLDED